MISARPFNLVIAPRMAPIQLSIEVVMTGTGQMSKTCSGIVDCFRFISPGCALLFVLSSWPWPRDLHSLISYINCVPDHLKYYHQSFKHNHQSQPSAIISLNAHRTVYPNSSNIVLSTVLAFTRNIKWVKSLPSPLLIYSPFT